ncbi:uncharacterized protein LY89DRAFT_199339 [Mollisia scopiformis]|uniref:Uncharacterized protein n=1 Tax=Mollisia scopiformis TaxID=149040 RepID=A0A194WZ85_MOLSC|nr:uncharacterized protein LY89DRAFT_199339 [Mollisia scopiformis]KUJ13024.1 hypothetical protein LY89DRAFT_199339 [Mollisia scopiformis]
MKKGRLITTTQEQQNISNSQSSRSSRMFRMCLRPLLRRADGAVGIHSFNEQVTTTTTPLMTTTNKIPISSLSKITILLHQQMLQPTCASKTQRESNTFHFDVAMILHKPPLITPKISSSNLTRALVVIVMKGSDWHTTTYTYKSAYKSPLISQYPLA